MRVRRALAYLNEAGRVRANLEHLGLTALAARVSSTSCVYAVGSRCPESGCFHALIEGRQRVVVPGARGENHEAYCLDGRWMRAVPGM
ncbi:hypothetical protein D7Y11_15505 [Corallococcus sp. AB018]|nr:hypothetical protein D7Y11_15505 [Corallococcus sp. AB018]